MFQIPEALPLFASSLVQALVVLTAVVVIAHAWRAYRATKRRTFRTLTLAFVAFAAAGPAGTLTRHGLSAGTELSRVVDASLVLVGFALVTHALGARESRGADSVSQRGADSVSQRGADSVSQP